MEIPAAFQRGQKIIANTKLGRGRHVWNSAYVGTPVCVGGATHREVSENELVVIRRGYCCAKADSGPKATEERYTPYLTIELLSGTYCSLPEWIPSAAWRGGKWHQIKAGKWLIFCSRVETLNLWAAEAKSVLEPNRYDHAECASIHGTVRWRQGWNLEPQTKSALQKSIS